MKKMLILLAIGALALGACAGDDPGSDVASLRDGGADASPDAQSSLDPEEARLAFSECMRENGVDVPDLAPGGGGGAAQPGAMIEVEGEGERNEFEEANEACRHLLEGVFDEPSEAEQQEFMDNALAFAQCMRDNGVEDHPDPRFEGGGMTIEISGDDIMEDPDFDSAEKECRKLLPGAGVPRRVGELETAP